MGLACDGGIERKAILIGRERFRDTELRSAVLRGVDVIEQQHVQMNIQVQGAAETLDEGDDARSVRHRWFSGARPRVRGAG